MLCRVNPREPQQTTKMRKPTSRTSSTSTENCFPWNAGRPYRPTKAVAESGHDCCTTESEVADDCCATTGKRRFNMMALNKVMLWGVTVLAVAFLFFPSYVGVLFGTSDAAAVTEDIQALFGPV